MNAATEALRSGQVPKALPWRTSNEAWRPILACKTASRSPPARSTWNWPYELSGSGTVTR